MEEKTLIAPLKPVWLNTGGVDISKDKEFYEIILFFVIHSPCPGQSWKGITLAERGWKPKPWASPKYLKEKLDKVVFGKEKRLLKMTQSKEEISNELDLFDLKQDFYLHLARQRMLYSIVNNTECKNEYMSLFYHTRNALAHGRFAMYPIKSGDIIFVMEDGKQIGKETDDSFEVTARIVIRKSSLLKIIALLSTPPVENDYSEDILNAIKGGKQTKKDIMEEVQIDEYTYNKYIGLLKLKNVITYQHKRWTMVNEYTKFEERTPALI